MADYNEQKLIRVKGIKGIVAELQKQIKQEETNLNNYLLKTEAESLYLKKTEVASAYKAKGSVADLAGLEGLNVADNVGNVYNVKAAFTTDETFLEGAGKSYPAGTNVVVVDDEETYKFDALAGITDLSDYQTTAQADAKYTTKEEFSSAITEETIEGKLAPYAKSEDVAATYETKANVTAALAEKANTSDIEDMLTKTEAGTTYIPQTEIASDEEVQALITELFPA